MADDWALIIFCLLYAVLSSYPSARNLFSPASRGHAGRPPRPVGRGKRLFFSQLYVAIMLVVLGGLGDWRPGEIGVSESVGPLTGLAAGLAAYLVFSLVFNFAASTLGVLEQLEDVSFEAMRLVWPREKRDKPLAIVGVCLLNPFTEEVMYRGVLIHALGNRLESALIAVIVSIGLTLLVHLYQGPKALVSQALFHSSAIAILFSPLGLVGCIGFHIGGDIVPVVTFRGQMLKWSKRARRPTRRIWTPPVKLNRSSSSGS